MSDATYQPKTYRKDGGDTLIVASGGVLDVESGGAFKIAGTQVTASAATLNALPSPTLASGAGAGITDGTGTIYKTAVQIIGGIYKTTLLLDLTGLASSTTDLDIIGTGTSAAYIAKLTAAECGGTILAIAMKCLEAPAGGIADIDLYSAVEGTGKFDDAVASTLTETALITAGGSWTNGTTKAATTAPAATEYLYLTGGAGGTAATYTAGKFLIEIYGY